MSPRNAEIIRLRKEGVSYTEIAAQMGISRNTVAGVLHRAGLQISEMRGRRHAPEVRRQAVEALKTSTWREVAQRFGASMATLSNWRRETAA